LHGLVLVLFWLSTGFVLVCIGVLAPKQELNKNSTRAQLPFEYRIWNGTQIVMMVMIFHDLICEDPDDHENLRSIFPFPATCYLILNIQWV